MTAIRREEGEEAADGEETGVGEEAAAGVESSAIVESSQGWYRPAKIEAGKVCPILTIGQRMTRLPGESDRGV
jgi:hypothetical protein